MTLLQVSLVLICACLDPFAAVIATNTVPARLHEARQGPISTETQPLSTGPGPVSLQTSSTMSTTTSSTSSLPSSASATSTYSASGTSSATPHPSSSPAILNITVHNMTTCASGLISWNYTGNEAELLLSITDIGVDQSYALSRFKTRQSLANGTTQQLVDTNTSVSSWSWSSVNITQGWYEIQGLVVATPTLSSNSGPFFIANGTDVTCLTGTPTASSSVSASPSSAASNTNVAGIVGVVVGSVLGVALAIIAGVCLWSRRRKRPLFGGLGRRNKNWGSLKSAESNVQPGGSGAQLAGDHFHAHSESTTGMLEDVAGGKGSATTTPGNSDEDAVIMGEEKLVSPASSSGMSPFDVLNTPVHHDHHASAYYSAQMLTPTASESSRSRSASAHTSSQSIEQQGQRIRSSMEIPVRRRSERLSMPTQPSPGISRLPHSPSHTQPKNEYPLSPVTPTPVNRSLSIGAASRRTSRKPVPQYDPSALLEDTNTDSVSVSTFTAGAESSQSHGTGMSAGGFGMPRDLVHKASFGDGRPVHYLIPDMPPPQRD